MIDKINDVSIVVQWLLVLRWYYYRRKLNKLIDVNELFEQCTKSVAENDIEKIIYYRQYTEKALHDMENSRTILF